MMAHTNIDLVIHHSNCADGVCGAWCIWRENRQAQLHPSQHGQPPPNVEGKNVVIVDFSYSREVLTSMAKQAKSIVVLDHHKSAERELSNLECANMTVIFDMQRSGAQIAWDWMYPEKDIPRPQVVEYVADRDLWTWKLPCSKAVNKALYVKGYCETVEKFEEVYAGDVGIIEKLAEIGETLLAIDNKQIEHHVNSAVMAELTLGDGKFVVGVSSVPFELRSEVGNQIASKYDVDFALMYSYDLANDAWYISCRTIPSKDVDLSRVCALVPGGGGHPCAAGFTLRGKHLTEILRPLPKK